MYNHSTRQYGSIIHTVIYSIKVVRSPLLLLLTEIDFRKLLFHIMHDAFFVFYQQEGQQEAAKQVRPSVVASYDISDR